MAVSNRTINKYQIWIVFVDHSVYPIESYSLDGILMAETEVFTQTKLSLRFIQLFTAEEDGTGFLTHSFFLSILPS